MNHRGSRLQITVRLPVDEYREVAVRARARGWSLSDYIGWCVVKELSPDKKGRAGPQDPLGLSTGHAADVPWRHDPGSPHAKLREAEDFGSHVMLGSRRRG
jgi:hypothetical protein